MRVFFTLAFAAAVLAFCAALFVLRGCQTEEIPESSPIDAAGEVTPGIPQQTSDDTDTVSRDREPSHPQPAPETSAEVAPSTAASPQTPDSSPRPPGVTDTAAEALATAQQNVTAAERVAESDPGQAFRLYAEAYGAVSAHPDDAACAAFAKTILPHLRNAAEQANASAGTADGKTLIEE